MMQRWYDKDPTLSMAISLLQNASKHHQEMVAKYLFQQLNNERIIENSEALQTKEDRVRFIFPNTARRHSLDIHCRHLLEVMKHLPSETQQRLALQIINYIYILDAGFDEELDLESIHLDSLFPLQSESSG